ncbi:organic cation transporter-like protein [Lucilia sericata]|uniref:organic cation transporter-like protein n=1 Tax=Lucilia sericata TaxID=13632 RepID=UPI0018A7ED20|nr:organic cation transporter-like protein [Lucilia sericata]
MEPKPEEKKIDPIIVHLGDMGRYQFWFCMLIFLSKFPTGWVQVGHVFLAAPTNYTCVDPEGADPCSEECKKAEYDRSVFEETIVTEFDLECGYKSWVSFSQTMVMFGIMLGNIIFGVLADKYGRRPLFVIACVLQLITGVTVSISQWFWFYVLFRFLAGLSTGGTMTTSFVLIMEIIGVSKREIISILYQIPFNLGHASLPLLSYFLRHWRWFNLSYSSFSVVYLIYICLCIESPRWLFTTGRLERAIPLLEKIARVNKMPTERIRPEIEEAYKNLSSRAPPKKGNLFDLFRSPNLRKKTIIMAFQWLNVCAVYFGVSQYISKLAGNIFLNVAIGGFLGMPGTIICVFMTKYLGRRLTLIISNFISAIGLLVIAMFQHLSSVLVVSFATMGLVGAAITFPNVYLYAGEIFPTVVRSNGVGMCSFFGRVGSMLAPFISELADLYGFLPPLIFGVVSLVGAVLTFILPETRGFPLPETIEDGEKFGKKERNE